jgi:sugar-specific transcriptional regulator TrmB
MINENNILRFKQLAGIIQENKIDFSASGGRSGKGTLGFYAEEYLLNLCSDFVTKLDDEIKKIEETLVLIKEDTKINKNNIFFKFKIKESKDEFSVNIMVSFEDSSNTKCIILFKDTKTEFDLTSKHSESDLKNFITNSVNAIINLIKL